MLVLWLPDGTAKRFAQLAFIAADNPAAAERIDQQIERQVDRLIAYHHLGRTGRLIDTRELIIPRTPFLAVYRIKPDRIEILRILHGAQEWPPRPA